MKKILFVICALLIPISVYAQTPAPTHYDYDIAGAANSTYTMAASTVDCNVTVIPGAPTTVNPRYLVWDGPTQGTVCVHDTGNNTGNLFALPIGDYSVTLYAVVATATNRVRSNPSNTVNFSRLVPPAARTGFRVRSAQ